MSCSSYERILCISLADRLETSFRMEEVIKCIKFIKDETINYSNNIANKIRKIIVNFKNISTSKYC